MNNREEILAEIQSISVAVATIPFVNVFTVDKAYFSTLHQMIMTQINVETVFPSNNNLTVPDGYFEGLADSILNKIHVLENDVAAELNEISPVVAGIENKETFTVPEGYFQNLEFVLEQKEPAKVVSINQPRSIFRYVAAAVITGLLGLSIANFVDGNDSSDPKIITAAINSVVVNSSFDEALNSISDKEIEQYLQKNGQDVNAALVASSIDDVEKLPEPSDYLLDENVLENYLKENNLNN